jgi:hypothetical protein
LGRALEVAGLLRRPGEVAHHIVAQNSRQARLTRLLLDKKFNIGIDDAENGVWLPRDEAAAAALGSKAAIHATLHKRAYYDAVHKALSEAGSKDEALKRLQDIRQRLLDGGYP